MDAEHSEPNPPPAGGAPRPRGRPRSEPVEVQRRRILDIARTDFTELGYEAATVADIAAKAGVSRAVVYEAVGDKEALLGTVVDELYDELISAFDAYFGAPEQVELPLAELVRRDLAWFVELIRTDPSYVPLAGMSALMSAHGDDLVSRARRRIEDRLTQLHIDRARQWGLPDRGESARVVALLVISLAEAIAFRVELDDTWPGDEATAIAVEFAIGGYQQVEGAGRQAITRFDALTTGPPGTEPPAG